MFNNSSYEIDYILHFCVQSTLYIIVVKPAMVIGTSVFILQVGPKNVKNLHLNKIIGFQFYKQI